MCLAAVAYIHWAPKYVSVTQIHMCLICAQWLNRFHLGHVLASIFNLQYGTSLFLKFQFYNVTLYEKFI